MIRCWTLLLVLGLAMGIDARADSPAQADAAPLARAAGATISQSDVALRSADRRNAEVTAYQGETHRLQVQHERTLRAIDAEALERLIDERVADREAALKHTSRDALLKGVARPEPTAAQVRQFYEERKEQIGAPFEVVSQSIHDHLASEAYGQALHDFYVGLRKKHGVELLLEPARDVIPGSGPSRGAADAPVAIVEFADFQCPYCVKVEPTLARALADYAGQVRLEFRQLPLTTLHAEAERAAEASACADEQQHFWDFHDLVFATQGHFDASTLIEGAAKVGVDPKAFRECLTSDRPAAVVKRDTQAADELAIGGTPAIFVNGRLLSGAVSYEQLASVIDDELRRQRVASRVADGAGAR